MTPTTTSDGGWPRWRLIATLATVGLAGLALLVGLALAIWPMLNVAASPVTPLSTAVPGQVHGDAYRDQIAAEPMLQVPPSAASTPQVSNDLAPTLLIPRPNAVGPAGVPTGFPHTTAGAVAQLGAIEVWVVQAMSIPVAHQVHDTWALPGGTTAADWAMTQNVQVFLTALGDQPTALGDFAVVAATPAAGLVKGTDGPDWVLACVLLDVRADAVTHAEIGYGHCERMAWHDRRWMIAPGTPPAPAPSVWPGSDLALKAGWRTWTSE